MRLVDALAAMDKKSFEGLCRRRGVVIDEKKRLSAVEQAARALAVPRDLGNVAHWPDDARSIVRVLAAAPRGVLRESLAGAVLVLVDAALIYPVPGAPGRVALPTTYRVQLPASASDDPRSARILLASLDEETYLAIGAHHLGHTPTGPRALVLGDLLERLESPGVVEAELASLPTRERALLAAVEARGSDVDVAELLELAQDPARYTVGSATAALPRRSAAYALLRRGLLLPAGTDLFSVPTEVAVVVGRGRRATAKKVRDGIVRRVTHTDLTPPRARFADDPGPAAVALLAALRSAGTVIPVDGGAPRTAVRKAAREAGVDPGHAEMLVALARADGLAAATTSLAEASARIFRAWRRGGAWDEARVEEDRYRAGDRLARIPTPTAALRAACLDVLEALPAGRFAVLSELVAAVLADLRASSAEAVLRRADARMSEAFETSPESVVRHLIVGSLPALGALDRGAGEAGELVRLSARARAWLGEDDKLSAPPPTETPTATWEGAGRLKVGARAAVGAVIALADAANVWLADGEIFVEVTSDTVDRAVQRGVLLETVRDRLLELARSLDAGAERALDAAAKTRIPCELLPVAGFLLLDDERLRDALLADDAARELFVVPSPSGGLLVREGVTHARVSRAVRRNGGEIGARKRG